MRRSGFSTDDIATLRRAAAVAHGIGAVGLTLLAGSIPTAQVAPEGAHSRSGDRSMVHRLRPCDFRTAVARAWDDYRAGPPTGNGGQPSAGLDVLWSVRPPGAVVGFGGVRAPCGGRMVWAFASLLTPDELRPTLGELARSAVAATTTGGPADRDDVRADLLHDELRGGGPTDRDDVRAHLLHDELLGTTLVHVEADRPDRATIRRLDEVLLRIIAGCAAAEVTLGWSTLPSTGR